MRQKERGPQASRSGQYRAVVQLYHVFASFDLSELAADELFRP